MSYIGNTPVNQNFVAGADQFSGTGSQTVFTLSRNVNTVFDIFVTVSNVPQDPFTAYTVAGNTLTFDGAPPSGTNNIDVVYRATNVQTFVPTPGVSTQLGLGSASAPSLTFIGDTNTGIYSPGADTIAFAEGGAEVARFDSAGNFGIGTSSPAQHVQIGNNSSATEMIRFASTLANFDVGMTASGCEIGTANNQPIIFKTNAAERARIDSSGNLLIGRTTQWDGEELGITGSASSMRFLYARSTSAGHYLSLGTNGTAPYIEYGNGAGLIFRDGSSERARITSGGIFTMQSSTANGVYIQSGSEVTLASNATITITSATAGACVILVYEIGGGEGGMFWANYTAVVTKVVGDGSATDAGAGIAVYKSAASHTTTIKNRFANTRTFRIAVYSAQANP